MPQSWSKDEEKQLLKQIKEGKTYDELAKVHNRSVSALIMRFNKIIYENIEGGKNKSSLAKLLNITIDKVNQSYYEHKAFLEKKGIENEVKSKDSEKKQSEKSSKSEKSSLSKSSKTKDKSEKDDGNKLKKMEDKLNILEKENRIMREIIENMKLKKKLGENINDKNLLKEVLKLIKSPK
jgi:hypothetical protein